MTSQFQHKELAAGRWLKFSLIEQLANIGSEVGRTKRWQDKDKTLFQGAFERALELFDLTLSDPRWFGRKQEIARARELFCAAALKSEEFKTSLNDLDKYFLEFAVAAQRIKL
ncbi:MAG: hypothetical protein WCX12_01100 [Candidatus Paceibacterota bacterium]|jgi:hypothetical protein